MWMSLCSCGLRARYTPDIRPIYAHIRRVLVSEFVIARAMSRCTTTGAAGQCRAVAEQPTTCATHKTPTTSAAAKNRCTLHHDLQLWLSGFAYERRAASGHSAGRLTCAWDKQCCQASHLHPDQHVRPRRRSNRTRRRAAQHRTRCSGRPGSPPSRTRRLVLQG